MIMDTGLHHGQCIQMHTLTRENYIPSFESLQFETMDSIQLCSLKTALLTLYEVR